MSTNAIISMVNYFRKRFEPSNTVYVQSVKFLKFLKSFLTLARFYSTIRNNLPVLIYSNIKNVANFTSVFKNYND